MDEGDNNTISFKSYAELIAHCKNLLVRAQNDDDQALQALAEIGTGINRHIVEDIDGEEFNENTAEEMVPETSFNDKDFEKSCPVGRQYKDEEEMLRDISNQRLICLQLMAHQNLAPQQKLAVIDHFEKFIAEIPQKNPSLAKEPQFDALIKGKMFITLDTSSTAKKKTDQSSTSFKTIDELIKYQKTLLVTNHPLEAQKLNKAIRSNLKFKDNPGHLLKWRLYKELTALEALKTEYETIPITQKNLDSIKDIYLNVMSAAVVGGMVTTIKGSITGTSIKMSEQVALAKRFDEILEKVEIQNAQEMLEMGDFEEDTEKDAITLLNYKYNPSEEAEFLDPAEFKPLTAKERAKYDISLAFNEKMPGWHQQDEIMPNLILGRIPKPPEVQDLIARGVKLIVTVLAPGEPPIVDFDVEELEAHGIKHIFVLGPDFKGSAMDPKLMARALGPMHEALLNGEGVYIHCKAGKARTGALATALLQAFGPDDDTGAYQAYQDYVRKELKLSDDTDITDVPEWKLLETTIEFLQSKRSQVSVSLGKQQRALEAIAIFKNDIQPSLIAPKAPPLPTTPEAYLASEDGKYEIRQLTAFKALGFYAVKLQQKDPNSEAAKVINEFFQFLQKYDVTSNITYQERWQIFEKTIEAFDDTEVKRLTKALKEDFDNLVAGKPLKQKPVLFNLVQLAGGKGKATAVSTADINAAISRLNPKMREYLNAPQNYVDKVGLAKEVNDLLKMMVKKIEGKKNKIEKGGMLKESEISDLIHLFGNIQKMVEALDSTNQFMNTGPASQKLEALSSYFEKFTPSEKCSAGQKFRFGLLSKQAAALKNLEKTNIKSPILRKAIEEKLNPIKNTSAGTLSPDVIKQINQLFSSIMSVDDIQGKYNAFLGIVKATPQINGLETAFKAAIESKVEMPIMEKGKVENNDALLKIKAHLIKLNKYLNYLEDVEKHLKAENLPTADLQKKIVLAKTKITEWTDKQTKLSEKINTLKDDTAYELEEMHRKKAEKKDKEDTLLISGTKKTDATEKETPETFIYTGSDFKKVSGEKEEFTGPYVEKFTDRYVVHPATIVDETTEDSDNTLSEACIKQALKDFIEAHKDDLKSEADVVLSGNPKLVALAESLRKDVWAEHLAKKPSGLTIVHGHAPAPAPAPIPTK